MILISKQESQKIRDRYPNAEIVRTCIQKSKRHKYYLPEKNKYLQLIQDTNCDAAKILKDKNRRSFHY